MYDDGAFGLPVQYCTIDPSCCVTFECLFYSLGVRLGCELTNWISDSDQLLVHF